MVLSLIIIALAVIFDQATKLLVVRFLDRNEPFDVIEGVFRFSYVENRGAAFGMFSENRWVFMIISSVAIIALLLYLFKFASKDMLLNIGISLVVGGGIGNMIDRVRLGYVVDFLDFCAFPDLWKWVFNVADACVCIGAGVIVLYLVIDIAREAKKQKAALAFSDDQTKETKEVKNKENE